MWIVLNKSFLSIVENRNNKIELLVRSRVKGDIEKVFSEANVFEDNTADYKYRSYIDRKIVAYTISKELMSINYDNFKNSVSKEENFRHNAYVNVWSALHKMQK